MAAFNPQADEMLSRLAQGHKGLDDFLSTIFAFFERRTDLFHVMQSPEDKMGFPPGIAEAMVLETFLKYQNLYQKRTGNRTPEGLENAVRRQATLPGASSVGKKVAAAAAQKKSSSSEATKKTSSSSAGASGETGTGTMEGDSGSSSKGDTGDSGSSTAEQAASGGLQNAAAGGLPVQLPEDSKMAHISTWNGAVTDKYRWSQSLDEITLECKVSSDEKVDNKQLKVDIKSERVVIKYKGDVILEGKLHERIQPEESIWNLEDKKRVVLNLEKIRKTWWKSVFEGDPEIDTSKVESVKRIHEYDPQTQGNIRKIVFDQNQKAQGLPTSDQIRTADLMKGAWNADGSPFKGTDFDPGQLNLTNQLPEHMFN